MELEDGDAHNIKLNLIQSEGPLSEFLLKQTKPDFQLLRFRVDPADAERVAAYHARAIELRDGDASGHGSVSAFAGGCLRAGANPFQTLRMKVYLKSDTESEFFTVLKDTTVEFYNDGEEKNGVTYCKPEDADRIIDG